MVTQKIRHWLFRHPERRFPFQKPPLRVAAQGVDERLEEEMGTFSLFVAALMIAPLAFVVLVLVEVFKNGMNAGISSAITYLVAWLVLAVFFLPFIWRKVRAMRDLHLGLMAERLIGQTLEQTRAWNCAVFHDLVIDGASGRFNIDHLVIGDRGIFVIETKGRSKPRKGEPRVKFDGNRLTFADGLITEDPLRQAAANVQWVRHRLFQLVREKPSPACRLTDELQLPVIPVVAYPGWYVDFSEAKACGSKTLVTNENLLLGCLQSCPPVLTKEETTELIEVLDASLRKQRKHLVENPQHRGCFLGI
ncbi:MAG: nuclease-related domain-containing protein [Lentisphaeria bacterium]